MRELIEKLEKKRSLNLFEYLWLLTNRDDEITSVITEKARKVREAVYGKDVYIRGLIEIGNICKNDCFYCGIRKSNKSCDRYRLCEDDILACCDNGYELGFRTFVMQGGEDPYFSDDLMCDIISKIKTKYPDCAVTLSLGEKSYESYKKLFDAGADRYLLRHETADSDHYEKLHPSSMSFMKRIECIKNLKEIGYQTGCGFMVGSPFQTYECLAQDLKFVERVKPEMCGVGPFIPHKATPFKDYPAGSAELTCYILSIIRLMHPNILLPATTALGTALEDGREKGILAGANVVMPNLSPVEQRKKYELYNNKINTGAEAAEAVNVLAKKMESIGYRIVTDRGDAKKGN